MESISLVAAASCVITAITAVVFYLMKRHDTSQLLARELEMETMLRLQLGVERQRRHTEEMSRRRSEMSLAVHAGPVFGPEAELVSPRWRLHCARQDGGEGRWEAWRVRAEHQSQGDASYVLVFVDERHAIPAEYDGMAPMLQRWQADHSLGPILADCFEDHWPDAPPTLLWDLRLPAKERL